MQSAPPAPVVVSVEDVYDGETHLEWATGVAIGVARGRGLVPGGQDEADLIAVAHMIVWDRIGRFDHAGEYANGDIHAAFRGYAHQSIVPECMKEVSSIRRGGCCPRYADTEGAATVRVAQLPAGDEENGLQARAPDPDTADALALVIDRAELDVTEEKVIRALYGIGRPECSAEWLARAWRVPVEQVREYEAEALAKLRRFSVYAGLVEADEVRDAHSRAATMPQRS